ncbi:hypothetical protein NC653_029551 [Populus alba x Populus x berolinensis]|uniref:Reverse transcriptase zinc-binding domain-containing protein n=1 Tax=Populus alba x Populus x berolinensis TaxID=444605 RepID=A0AAD6M2P7_9ROSI|nr:hypothetical protein NC653_029551 [Populus alba x Populus x berolinensis]
MSKCLNLVRKKRNNVAWHKLLWGPLPVPRRSFIAWLSILNSLSTKSRQLRRGRNIDTTCSLFQQAPEDRDHFQVQQAPEDRDHFQVQQAPEDRDHLFFSCSFTKKIWQCFFKEKWNLQAGDRQEELDCAISFQQKNSPVLLRLSNLERKEHESAWF